MELPLERGYGHGRNLSVYLAGPMKGLTWNQGHGWRQYCKEQLAPEIAAYSPMRGKDGYIQPDQIMGAPIEEQIMTSTRFIASRDKFDVTRAGVVLANFTGATVISGGTFTEFGWASAMDIPLITIIEDENNDDPDRNPNRHPMIIGLSSVIVHDLDQGIQLVRAYLLPD